MLSSSHETLVDLFRQRPALAAELLSGALGVPLPDWEEARLDSAELPDTTPTEYRADAVVTLTDSIRPVLAVVVEVQLAPDKRKRWSWPVYLATLRARLRCPTVLLVVCPQQATARWCATPIDLGHPQWVLAPMVAGPDRVPLVTDPEQARGDPELAVLSVLAHRSHPDVEKIGYATWAGLEDLDAEHTTLYSDVVLAALPAAIRQNLENLMRTRTYEYQTEFVRRYVYQGRAEGEAKGEAKAVLTVMAARGIDVPEVARARITACTDLDQLDTWVRRAATADSVEDLFDQA